MNCRARREYLEAIRWRYRQAELREKQVILNEFCRNTGYKVRGQEAADEALEQTTEKGCS